MREKLLVSFFILSGFVRYAEKPKSRANFDFAEYGFRYEKHNGQNKNDKGLRWRFFRSEERRVGKECRSAWSQREMKKTSGEAVRRLRDNESANPYKQENR